MKLILPILLLSFELARSASVNNNALSLCKNQISLSLNPAQLCYQVLHADPPKTITSTITGPISTAKTTTSTTVAPVTVTSTTVTASTPTSTITSTTTTSTTTTYTIVSPSSSPNSQKRDMDKRLLSIVSNFGQAVVNEACFELIYGGKTPSTTIHVAGPTVTSTSTISITPTISATSTITPAVVTTTTTTSIVATSTVTFAVTAYGSCENIVNYDSSFGADDPSTCAQTCADQTSMGTCNDFAFTSFEGDPEETWCYLSKTPLSESNPDAQCNTCGLYQLVPS